MKNKFIVFLVYLFITSCKSHPHIAKMVFEDYQKDGKFPIESINLGVNKENPLDLFIKKSEYRLSAIEWTGIKQINHMFYMTNKGSEGEFVILYWFNDSKEVFLYSIIPFELKKPQSLEF